MSELLRRCAPAMAAARWRFRFRFRFWFGFWAALAGAACVIGTIWVQASRSEAAARRPILRDAGTGPFYRPEEAPPRRMPRGTLARHPLLESIRRLWVPGDGVFPIPEAAWKARMAALCGFAREGPGAAPLLTAALDDEDPRVRAVALQALGIVGDRSLGGLLDAVMFGDPDGECRIAAAHARGMIGGMAAGPLHRWCLAMDRFVAFREHLKSALSRGPEPRPQSLREAYARYDLSRMNSARVGERAPDFELPLAQGGGTFRLADFRGKSDVVLVFIYGST